MKILIATDGSNFSEAAVETACRMIENAENAQLRVVSVYEQPIMAVASAPYAMPVPYSPVLETEMKKAATQAVTQAELIISERFPSLRKNLTTSVLCGDPKRLIVEEAENWDADLIVTGSHGYGLWERMILGSVSNSVIHHAPCSVLVVRSQTARTKDGFS
jgi:nucleotide-binding universal stress UspA family protein